MALLDLLTAPRPLPRSARPKSGLELLLPPDIAMSGAPAPANLDGIPPSGSSGALAALLPQPGAQPAAVDQESNPYESRGGLASLLFGADSDIAKWSGANSNKLSAIGAALLSPGMDFSGVPAAAARDDQRRALSAEWVKNTNSKRDMLKALRGYGFEDIAQGLENDALDISGAFSEMLKRQGEQRATAQTNAHNSANAAFINNPALRQAVESGAMDFGDAYKLENGGSATNFGMTPIWGTFANGTMGYGVQGSDGQFHPVDTNGFTPMDPRTLATERAAGVKIGGGEGTRTLDAPVAAANVTQLNAKTDHVIDTIDKAIGQLSWDSTGLIGQTMGAFGGSKAYDLRRTAETIKANLGFTELQAMRDASPTGGALGSVAVQELVALQSTLESLDPNQSEDQLRKNLEQVAVLLERQKGYRQQAYEAKYGPYDGGAPPTPPAAIPGPTGEATAVETQAQYDALPPGTRYLAPDGQIRTKQ